MLFQSLNNQSEPIVVSLVMLLIFFLLHFTLWRLFSSLRSITSLMLIALATLYIGLGIGQDVPIWSGWLPDSLWGNLILIQFNFFMTCGYMVCYSGIEEKSPSLLIIKEVNDAGKEGVPIEAMLKFVNDDFLIEQRVGPLIRSKMITRSGDHLILLPRGLFVAKLFHLFRVCTKSSKGV